jgi:hypothetical protein
MCSGVFQHWCCTCLFSFCIEVLSQEKQRSGPFNFPCLSSLMRGCRNLKSLSLECCDWSACVGSESWGELPVPPAEMIARGTRGVFQFVKAALRVRLVASRSCRVMVVGPQMVRPSARTFCLCSDCCCRWARRA